MSNNPKEIIVYYASGHKVHYDPDRVVFWQDGPVREWLDDGYTVINMDAVSFIKPAEPPEDES